MKMIKSKGSRLSEEREFGPAGQERWEPGELGSATSTWKIIHRGVISRRVSVLAANSALRAQWEARVDTNDIRRG